MSAIDKLNSIESARTIEESTSIAHTIDITERQEKYDAACKSLLSEKIILAWILKYCVKEFKDYKVTDIAEKYIDEDKITVGVEGVDLDMTNAPRISNASSEDSSVTEGMVRYDIRFEARIPRSRNRVGLIINVEAQNDDSPGYPLLKRAVYYCGRLISAQHMGKKAKETYKGLKKVYSIWVCINPSVERENTINSYQITEENLLGGLKEKEEFYDLLRIVMIGLSGTDENKNTIEDKHRLIGLLDTLLSSTLEKDVKKKVLEEDFDIPMTQKIEREVSIMSNLGEGLWKNAKQEQLIELIKKKLNKGKSLEQIADELEESVETIRPLYLRVLKEL